MTEDKISTTLSGLLAGGLLLIGIIAGKFSYINSSDEAKIIREEGRPAIIRTYEHGRKDHIFVESSEKPGNYITLDAYLETIKNEYDKNIERAKIEKLVDW